MKTHKFLFLLFFGIASVFMSCTKEVLTNENPDNSGWKNSDWKIIKSNVVISGVNCTQYQNVKTGQVVFEASENTTDSKAITYDRYLLHITGGDIACILGGDRCALTSIDGVMVYVVKYKK